MWSLGGRKKREIFWWEPRWAYVPRFWRRNALLFLPRFVINAFLLFSLLFAVHGFFPMLFQFGRFPLLAQGGVGLVGYILFQVGLHIVSPPGVNVRKDRISVKHMLSTWRVDAENVHAIRLAVFAENRIRLRVLYSHYFERRTKTIGVALDVDLDKLIELLPVKPVVLDARKRGRRLPRVTAGIERRMTGCALKF